MGCGRVVGSELGFKKVAMKTSVWWVRREIELEGEWPIWMLIKSIWDFNSEMIEILIKTLMGHCLGKTHYSLFSFTLTCNTFDSRCVGFFQHRLILQHQLDVLQFNSILTLSSVSADSTG